MKNNTLPFNLQFFAESPAVPDTAQTPPPQAQVSAPEPQAQTPTVDYAKIQQMLEGTLSAKEDTALKAYFKQQGLSQQEAEQAMQTFKAQKAQNQPDIGAIQTQLTQAQEMAKQAMVEKEATLEALALGVDLKTIPYLIKLADLSKVTGEEGKVNQETMKNALSKVLEDVPQLKQQKEDTKGFQIGGSGGQQQTATPDALKGAFGLL